MADFEECMELLGLAATHEFSGSFDRLLAARHWAALARFHKHDTTCSAYKETISILQHALTVDPTLQAQHDFLLRSESRTLTMDAASYAVEENQLEQAIEILEHGRGLLWSQLRGFGTPLDKLGCQWSARESCNITSNVDLLFPGFRSVIGSMWEVLGKDGHAFARIIYEYINISDCEEGEANYKRAAGGLHKAALELKARDGIQAERWVNLIHIGA